MAAANGTVWNPDVMEIVPEMDFSGIMSGPHGVEFYNRIRLFGFGGFLFDPSAVYSPSLVRDFYRAIPSSENMSFQGFTVNINNHRVPFDPISLCLVFGNPFPLLITNPGQYKLDNEVDVVDNYLDMFGEGPFVLESGNYDSVPTVSLPANVATVALWVMKNILGYRDVYLVDENVMHIVWGLVNNGYALDISLRILEGVCQVYNTRRPCLHYPFTICKVALTYHPALRTKYTDWIPIKPMDPLFWIIRRSRQVTWRVEQELDHTPPCHRNDDFLNAVEDDKWRLVLNCVFAWRDRVDGYRT